ncbi:MAG: hypothetical protein ABI620_03345 [Chloroflexota bacterium]
MSKPARIAALLAAAVLTAGACAGVTRTTFPPPGSSPAPVGDRTSATIIAVTGALAAAGLPSTVANRQYRPPEGALLAAAPRSVVQATLPDDPAHGFVVVYAFASPIAARAAADDQAAYVASGIGRVQFAPDARFMLRVLGSTVIFFWWSPGAALDARAPSIEDALSTIGDAVEVAA